MQEIIAPTDLDDIDIAELTSSKAKRLRKRTA
jgi:hypothetical protein